MGIVSAPLIIHSPLLTARIQDWQPDGTSPGGWGFSYHSLWGKEEWKHWGEGKQGWTAGTESRQIVQDTSSFESTVLTMDQFSSFLSLRFFSCELPMTVSDNHLIKIATILQRTKNRYSGNFCSKMKEN